MNRRRFVQTSLAAPAATALVGLPWAARAAATTAPEGPRWRVYEVTTRVEIVEPAGAVHAWIPLPLTTDTDYQKALGNRVSGNGTARIARDEKYAASFVHAEWAEGEKAPVVEALSRFATRDRAVDFRMPGSQAPEDRATLARYLAPTKLLPTDGIVRKTAQEITKGQQSDVERARALYEWIVENTFRDPRVRGCGLGDIRGMLETRNLGGKCADLNALFVGLCRSLGIPARDVYGVRVADSADFRCLGKSGDITRAQHCRAEFYLPRHGWVAADPADVRKVVLEEKPGLTLADSIAQKARAKLFGAWEMNWLAFNYAHDLALPGATLGTVPFLMYPNAEVAGAWRDSLEPVTFRYEMTSREIAI